MKTANEALEVIRHALAKPSPVKMTYRALELVRGELAEGAHARALLGRLREVVGAPAAFSSVGRRTARLSMKELVGTIRNLGSARVGELVEKLGQPRAVVLYALNKAREQKLVKLSGVKRRARWSA